MGDEMGLGLGFGSHDGNISIIFNVGSHKYIEAWTYVCVCTQFVHYVNETNWKDVYLHMCLWLMNNFVSENVSLPITIRVCLCVRVWAHPGVLSLLALSCDSLTVFGEVLIDEEPPPRRVLSEHEGLAAGSTNPRAPNSAICPAMCSHLPAGSTQHCACLTHWLCDWDCAAPDWDQYFNEPGTVKC